MKIIILVPIYNDWQSITKLIHEINNLTINQEFQISILIVNDASKHDRIDEINNLENINSVKIVKYENKSRSCKMYSHRIKIYI